MKIYHGEWKSQEDMCKDFNIDERSLEGCTIIYADYDRPPYEGYAFVVFEKRGNLFEVNASHCSCYGLEGKWKPEENDYEALMARPNVSKFAKENLKLWKNPCDDVYDDV